MVSENYKDKNVVKITGNFDDIYTSGLINWESNYFIAKKDGKYAIYEYKEGESVKITDDFDEISEDGLVKGQSNYYTIRDNGETYIIHKQLNNRIKIRKNKSICNYQNQPLVRFPLPLNKC